MYTCAGGRSQSNRLEQAGSNGTTRKLLFQINLAQSKMLIASQEKDQNL